MMSCPLPVIPLLHHPTPPPLAHTEFPLHIGIKRGSDELLSQSAVSVMAPATPHHADNNNQENAKKVKLEQNVGKPSRVIHIRNIPNDVTEAEIIHLGIPFGRVTNVLVLKGKNQAFLEMADESAASAMVTCYAGCMAQLRGRAVYVQFSNHRELKTDQTHSNASASAQAALQAAQALTNATPPALPAQPQANNVITNGQDIQGGPNTVLRVIIEHMIYPISLDVLHLIFQRFGKVLKIVTFTKNNSFQALIQYPDTQSAQTAKQALDGQNIYNSCCTLRIDYSKMSSLNVKYNNDKSRDFTNPTLPTGDGNDQLAGLGAGLGADILLLATQPRLARDRLAGSGAPGVLSNPFMHNLASPLISPYAGAVAGGIPGLGAFTLGQAPPGLRGIGAPNLNLATVLLVSNLNEEMVTPDALFTLFGVYGDVQRVKILYNKKDSALVQLAEPHQAQLAITHMDKLRVFGKNIRVMLSKHQTVQLPKEGQPDAGLTKDYSQSPLHRFKKPGSKNYQNIYPPSSTLHLSNIPTTVTEEEIKEAFTKNGFQVKAFKFFPKDRKMALIQLPCMDEAVAALIKMHNYQLSESNHLRCNFAAKMPNKKRSLAEKLSSELRSSSLRGRKSWNSSVQDELEKNTERQNINPGRRSQGNVSMATTARFPAQAVSGGGDSNPPTPSAASEPSPPPPPPQPTPQLIVLPASLHQAAGNAVVNGVPVIDVSALEQSADSSNESASSVSGHQGESAHDSDPTQPSPHFITVTEATARSYASLTPVQPAVVAEGDTVASHQGYHVQYVEPELYASQPNGGQAQMAYPVYTVGESGTLYASQGQYYAATAANTAAGTTGTVGYAAGGHYLVQQAVDEGLIASAQQRTSPQTTAADTAYVATATVHSTPAPGQSSEEVTSALSHATRVSPATVQWLLENYETAEGVSLPRSTLYSHYLRHCAENKLEPVNAASFGKLIRSVFLGLRTRRLGTRGNSKYHYYGIRVKPGSTLTGSMDETSRGGGGCMQNSGGNISSGKGNNASGRFKRSSDSYDANTPMITQHHGYLGEGSGAIPDFPDIHFNSPLPEDCSLEDVDTLKSIYREHCEAFLDAVLQLEFATVESLWREFWRAQDNNNGDECEEEKYLSKSKLFALCALEPVQSFMRHVDMQFYQNLVQVLLPDVLRPIPSSLTQAIRNFAKSLESWLTSAMTGCPQAMLTVKLTAVSAFSQSLRRYTSLNHLAQAARAVLHNGTQIAQMLTDLNRVDFHNVQEQASWVCQCDYDIVQRLEADFKLTLQQQNSLEQWAVWLKNVVQSALKPYEGKPNYSKAARQFLLKWSFYSSMVIRDLTLRSAASFGSFHLIRLLYDEYMFYLIEHQVAQATGVTPIAVMTEGNKMNDSAETILGMDLPPCNGGVVLSPHTNNKHIVTGSSDGTSSKRMKMS